MASGSELKNVIEELMDLDPVTSAVVISRSGMHIEGSAPGDVHLETFVAMSAILLGSAETAIAELKGELDNVVVQLNNAQMVLVSAGQKALLVVVTNASGDMGKLLPTIKDAAGRIGKAM